MFKRKTPGHQIIHDYRTDKQARRRFWPIIMLGILLFLCLLILTLGVVEPVAAREDNVQQLLQQQQQQIHAMEQAMEQRQENLMHLLGAVGLGFAYILLFAVMYFSIRLEDEENLTSLQKYSLRKQPVREPPLQKQSR